MLPLGTRTSNPAGLRIKGVGSTKPPSVSLGMMVNGASPASAPWLLMSHVFFLLGTQHHKEVSDLMHQGWHSNFQNVASELML